MPTKTATAKANGKPTKKNLFPFAKYEREAFPHQFRGQIQVDAIAGGVPSDPRVAEGWLKSKLADSGDLIRDQVAQIMDEREIGAEEAAEIADKLRHLNGFKRVQEGPHDGELYIEGRQLKAALKEAASIAVAAGKLKKRGWGETNKGILSFMAEHVFIVEDILPLGVTEPDSVEQRFIHTFRGNGIQYEEVARDVTIDFTVITDQDLTQKEWAMIWLTGCQQGIGAARSQGYGRYKLVEWEPIS